MTEAEYNQEQSAKPPYPNVPPLIESRATEYQGTGIPSTVGIFGHPIHPALVVFPIGLLVSVLGTDIGYWITRDAFWARASIWLIGLGLVSGLVAGAVGAVDFIRIPRVRKRTAGWAHMLLNVAALVLSAVNFGLRLGNLQTFIIPVGIIISLIVAVLLGVSGWYGGELSYRHKVGVIGPGETRIPER